MPLTRCQVNGKQGWRWGKSGKCYVGTGAAARALRQARAIHARGRTENAAKKRAPNPLKQDPTRTLFLRKRFQAELKKRFNRVKRALAELVVKEDALGLAVNAFCATGPGGGVDPTCSPSGGGLHSDGRYRGTVYRGGEVREDPSGTFGRGYYFTSEESIATAYAAPVSADVRSYDIETGKLFVARDYDSVVDPVRESYGGRSFESSEVMAAAITDYYSSKGYAGIAVSEHLVSPTDTIVLFKKPSLTSNVRWAFRSDADKLKEFKKWLEQQFAGEVLSRDLERAYWDAYIEEGWRTGAGRAFDDTKVRGRRFGPGEGDFYRGTKQQFLETSFGIPVSQEKIKLLAERVYTDLKGITDESATRMSRVLTDGLVQGKSPREVARDLDRELDLGRSRSLMIARTETIRAHAEGQFDAMELLGVEEIGVAVEWSVSGLGVTALGNPSPCEICAPLEGVVMTIQEAKGLLPRHPGCMCSYIPANVGEDTEDQKRSRQEISRAIDASIHAESPSKRTLAEQRGQTRWAGADKTIRKTRPRELVPTID